MAVVYLGLGANTGDCLAQLRQACLLLKRHPAISLQAVSSLYHTAPAGFRDQPWFLNAVARLHTSLKPEALLSVTQAIERRLGRVPTRRWGPRPIDLDLLLYGAQQVQRPFLTIPHPRLRERPFVLVPLLELDPALRLPSGESLRDVLRACPGGVSLRAPAARFPLWTRKTPMSHEAHRRQAPSSVRCAVITVSDTRTPQTDTSGQFIQQALQAAGHQVRAYTIVKDEPEEIRRLLQQYLDTEELDAVLLSGGTGLAPRDTTYEVVQACLEKELPGFGELFRYLSYAEIGAAAMLSRATAGVARGKVIVAMPGSTAAVRLAMEKLVVPELAHMSHLARG
ncbi:MAG: hypothetical protein KatS3mg131_0007 [Candidatus Tectimicrobiota bacterium]|nr:MAG: hypothetical protein KatS3mg131_0007 [Candidatus Tectomicrobia bacterium]